MRAFLLCALVTVVVGVGFFACNPNSIGRPCVNPQGSAVLGTQISEPALECPSRLCLIQPPAAQSSIDGGSRAVCTAECQSNGDCDPETTKYCAKGFACAVAAAAGPFCCKKVCICKEDLVPGVNQDPVDGGTILPHSCDPMTYQGTGMTPQCPNVKLTQ
jgi:hypothetical protein